MLLSNRQKQHSQISTRISSLNDEQISDLLHKAKPLHSGYGGTSALLMIDETPVFVKKVPLTDLERQSQHSRSTANIFELPLFYQYGVGSNGFGAWRELAAHLITTNWVLSEECPNFPLLYHCRILPTAKPEPMDSKELEELDSDVQYWDNSQSIRNRLEAIRNSSAHLVLFLEYIPQTLSKWLSSRLQEGETASSKAISFVEENLKTTIDFINARDFLHFDAHFNNMLTDGQLVYFSDFGLVLSSHFDLNEQEIEFLNSHRNYDRCASIASFLHNIITSLFGQDRWEMQLRNYVNGDRDKLEELSPAIAATIKRYAPIALVFRDEFFRSLQNKSKSTPYPATRLDSLLLAI